MNDQIRSDLRQNYQNKGRLFFQSTRFCTKSGRRYSKAILLTSLLFVLVLPSLSCVFTAASGSNPEYDTYDDSCAVTVKYENAAQDAIQLALNSAAEGKILPVTICVAPGIYPEQLNITTRGGISLVGLGNSNDPTVIEPLTAAINNFDDFFNDPQIALILVGSNGTSNTFQGINIRNLVINGAKASQSLNNYPICYSDYAGIMYNGGSGLIMNNVVENMYAPLAQAGCGTGGGINVDKNNNLSPNETVMIANNVVVNYGTFGIACFGVGIACNITQNMISPYVKYAPPGGAFFGNRHLRWDSSNCDSEHYRK